MATVAFAVMSAGFIGGVLVAGLWPSPRGARVLASLAAATGSAAALLLGAAVLAAGTPWTWSRADLLRPLGGLALAVDPLGALFLIVIGFTGVSSAIYGMAYLRHLDGTARARVMHALLNVFLASMCLVAAASNVLTFLFGWELMAAASYLLVVSDADREEARSAGLWYAAMTHAGFVLLLAAFLALAGGGALDFPSIREHAATLPAATARLVFVLAIIAFGSKAGLVPLHVWLPRAHPAAPSHVSALMSAAMVKLGVYGALRVFFDLMPPGPAWWGGVVLSVGVATALTGVLYSVAEPHLKRLLAYSTIENVGLIFVGLGFALLMRGYGYEALAAAGVVVCLLHVVSHAAIKTVLFLAAGAVLHSTHATSLEAYGGLIRRMPHTAILCLIGALSLAALPPSGGFPSEWLTFQVLVAGARHTAPELAIWLPLALAAVALTAGLAAVSAVRLFGITFLALPRTAAAAEAVEAPGLMRIAIVLPVLASIALGLAPGVATGWLSGIAAHLGLPAASVPAGVTLTLPATASRYWPPGLVLLLFGVGAAIAIALRARRGARAVRTGPVWNCGRAVQSARMEYTAAAFAEPLKRVFRGFYQPTQRIEVVVHPESPYFVRSMGYQGQLAPWMEQAVYGPLLDALRWTTRPAERIETGSMHLYLALLPAALVALLFVSRWIR